MLRFDKITHKNQEAIENALQLASEFNHPQIELEHLTYALLKEEGGIIA